jgi:DNA-binding transcriptional MerR regulator
MAGNGYAMVLWRTEHGLLTVEDLASAAGLNSDAVETFLRFGLIEPCLQTGSCPLFQGSSVERLQRIQRLRQDLGVNFAGVAVILEMAERIENLQAELEFLRGRLEPVD